MGEYQTGRVYYKDVRDSINSDALGSVEDPHIKDLPMPDIRVENKKIREAGFIGESGADHFFCNEFQCIKEKDAAMKLSGMPCHEDMVVNMLNKMGEEYKDCYDRITRIKKDMKEQEALFEALAVKFGYEKISFGPVGVKLEKNQKLWDSDQETRVTEIYPTISSGWDSAQNKWIQNKWVEHSEGWDV